MYTSTTDIMIIGGGASGLAAAVAAKRLSPALSVTILERNPRVGKKISATGNGRCNIGNTLIRNENYFGSCKQFAEKVQNGTQSTQDFFQSMGLYCRAESDGRLYPYDNHAISVLDTLRLTAEHLQVSIFCNCMIKKLRKEENNWIASTDNQRISAKVVIVATGGLAAPQTGSDGMLFPWLKEMGHEIVTCKPALVSFLSNAKSLHTLKGIRLPAKVSAISKRGEVLASDVGEVQFTEHAISGISVMNLSALCTVQEPTMLSLRLFPEKSKNEIEQNLWELYGARANWCAEDWLTGFLPKKAGIQLLRDSKLPISLQTPIYEITSEQVIQVRDKLCDWRFPITARNSWKNAQVTAGGVAASSVDANLQSTSSKGLFFAGEILDLHGLCGGYNLNWAWRSGQYAGANAVKFAKGERIS